MDALASVIKDPLGDPFLFEEIAIQSRGMKQWISIELAKKNGICANIKFSFPREIIETFSLKQEFDSNLLFWKIMDFERLSYLDLIRSLATWDSVSC